MAPRALQRDATYRPPREAAPRRHGPMERDYTIFSGTANPALAQAIAQALGVPLAASRVERFPDGETTVELLEPPRRKEVFIVQPTCPPVNDNLFELLAFTDACRRAAAGHITAIVPYFGYARSDKRQERREPINASLVATLMQAAGVNHVVTVDLHAPQIEGFFHVPTDSLSAVNTLTAAFHDDLPDRPVVVSPDEGRVRMATRYAGLLDAPVAVLHKERRSGAETSVLRVVGDVENRHCLVVDDMISTGGTIASSVEALVQAGAIPDVTVAATHGLMVPPAEEKLAHPAIRRIYVTDTVPLDRERWPDVRVASVAPLLAATIERFMTNGSIGDLL